MKVIVSDYSDNLPVDPPGEGIRLRLVPPPSLFCREVNTFIEIVIITISNPTQLLPREFEINSESQIEKKIQLTVFLFGQRPFLN